MAMERKAAIVSSIAVLVMIVAIMTEVDARISSTVGDLGRRNLLQSAQSSSSNKRHIKVDDERRNLYDIVGAMAGKHCCNKLVTSCCAPAPAPKPSSRSKSSSSSTPPKASSNSKSSKAAPAPKASSKASTSKTSTSMAPSPKASKASSSKTSSKAPAPKASKAASSKSSKAPTPKSPKAS